MSMGAHPSAAQQSAPAQPARAGLVALSVAARSEAIMRSVLLAIRGAIGLMFVACGLRGMLDFAPAQGAHLHQDVMAFGGALLLVGSLLPLLKGTEVLMELVLDLRRALGAGRAEER
jgi:hypothetical protein